MVTTLQSTEATLRLTGPIAYSPDGRSLACASDTFIVIWDVQTGGVAKEVKCTPNNTALVWSLTGLTIGTISHPGGNSGVEQTYVNVYDVASGSTLFANALNPGDSPLLWAHEMSFRAILIVKSGFASTDGGGGVATVDVFGAGHVLTKVHSFSLMWNDSFITPVITFSPTTGFVSFMADRTLRIFENWNSNCLLEARGYFFSHTFSSDGKFFAASQNKTAIHVWKYYLSQYPPWREFPCQAWTDPSLQFSPTLLSILGHSRSTLQVWRLEDLPAFPATHRTQHGGLTRSGHIATTDKSGRTITITNPHSETPSQVVSGGKRGFVIIGNILLAEVSDEVFAWLLTGEGAVSGLPGDRPADYRDRLWAVSLSQLGAGSRLFSVEGQVVVVDPGTGSPFSFDAETGKILPTSRPRGTSSTQYHLNDVFRGRHYLYFQATFQNNAPLEGGRRTSQISLRESWVRDQEGECRLWMPVEWRTSWDPIDWCPDVATQFTIVGGKPIIVKF